jgi:hypothetical protein
MSTRDWQIGPVLKNKLNSQGTLFRGGTKWSSDQRFPKGYTPERQAEVAEAVVRPSTSVYLDQRGVVKQTGTQSKEFKDRKVRTSGSMSDDNLVHDSRQPVRSLVDNIARSTVPVTDLSGVHFRVNQTTERLRKDTVGGHYDRRGDAMTSGEPVIRIRGGQEDTPVAIHEIGHHVSYTQGNQHAVKYDTPETRGREEGFADDYALEHYRGFKGERESPYHVYAGGSRNEERTEAFYAGYHAHRGTEALPRLGEPSHWELRRNREAAEDDASALFHRVPDYANAYTGHPKVNPDALPEGKTPEDVNPVRKTSNWHDKYRW